MSNGERPTTTLRVGSETSNINIDRGFITKRPHTESTVFGAIIWCQARFFYLKIKNQISNFDSYAFADIDTLDCVVKNGYSPVDYYLSSLHIFKSANPIAGLNQYRVTKMNEWLYFDSNQELYHTIHLLNKYMPKDGH